MTTISFKDFSQGGVVQTVGNEAAVQQQEQSSGPSFFQKLQDTASIDNNLKYGMKSNEVSELQDFLSDKGFLTTNPSGFFGLLTLKAVKAFQLSEGLPSTGFVGLMTRTVINEALIKDTLSSTEAEVQETGTTTPMVTTPPVVYHAPTPTPVVEPVVENYTLNIRDIKEYEDMNGYCNCKMVISFSFVPVAIMNGTILPVASCTLNELQLQGKVIGGKVIYGTSNLDTISKVKDNIPNTVSCTLVNGKVLSN